MRDTCIEGESGLLAQFERYGLIEGVHYKYNAGRAQISLWNGALIKGYSAEEPKRLRGPGFYGAWCDELAAWRYPEAFDMLMFTLSQGPRPQVVISTTPLPTKLIRSLSEEAQEGDDIVFVTGSTYDNAANLPPEQLAELRSRYEGTRLGRQELHAEILLDTPGALWTYDLIVNTRVRTAPELARVVVACDPSGGGSEESGGDEVGIIVVGRGTDKQGYVLADWSGYFSSAEYGRRLLRAYDQFEADEIVYEDNFSGDQVRTIIHQLRPGVRCRGVHAKRSKVLRAAPIAALFEQNRCHLVGTFPELEEQMSTYVEGDDSPDRLDAMVHGVDALGIGGGTGLDDFLDKIAPECPYCGFPNAPTADHCSQCAKPLQSGAA